MIFAETAVVQRDLGWQPSGLGVRPDEDEQPARLQAARAAAFLALVGIVNLPIVHFSVNWWNTLHQGSTVKLFGPSLIDSRMLWPLLTMAAATHFHFFASLFSRARIDLLELEGGKDWARTVALRTETGA